MATVKYKSRATNEIVDVEVPLDESVVTFTMKDGSKHQLMRSLFDGKYFSTELPKANADALQALRTAAGGPGNPIGVVIEDPPVWFSEFVQHINGRLDALELILLGEPAAKSEPEHKKKGA